MRVRRCISVASSDSGGGAGIQADLKAFAAAGCYGTSAIVAITAQNTVEVRSLYELPAGAIEAQLSAIFDDIGCDAAKTGALVSQRIVELVATFFDSHRVPLVVDPVLVASSGRRLLAEGAVDALIAVLLPLATVVTPNRAEAEVLAGESGPPEALAEWIVARGAGGVVITGGGETPLEDHVFDGTNHTRVAQHEVARRSTHGSGCTYSATLTAELAKGTTLVEAAKIAARVTATAIAAGVEDLGAGEGPVDVLGTLVKQSRDT